jgi:hypothetical protein
VRAEQRRKPSRRIGVREVLARDPLLEGHERIGVAGQCQREGVGAALDRP